MFLFVFPAEKQMNGCAAEDGGRREAEDKPVLLALTEQHMSCVTGKIAKAPKIKLRLLPHICHH